MTVEQYENLKVGDKVHHVTKNKDLYLKCWVHLRVDRKIIGGFSEDPNNTSIGIDDTILISPEYLELV